MPLYWRSIMRQFFAAFVLIGSSFIALLLIIRFQEIARFIHLAGDIKRSLLFLLLQIPYLLPFAIPLSTLLAALLTSQSLSRSHELTAYQVAGLSMRQIASPILYSGGLLALLNFMIISEWGPACRQKAKEELLTLTLEKPLALLTELKPSDTGFFYSMARNGKLILTLGDELKASPEKIEGKHVTTITTLREKEGFDTLVIDEVEKFSCPTLSLSYLLVNPKIETDPEHLPLKWLIKHAFIDPNLSPEKRIRSLYELSRRPFYALVTLSFAFLGFSFGIQSGRRIQSRKTVYALGLTLWIFLCFFAAKSFHKSPLIAFAFYIALPHSVVCILSAKNLRLRS